MAVEQQRAGTGSRELPGSSGRVHVLGGVIERSPRVSWAPPGASGVEPLSCFLIRGDRGAVLIDTGVGAHAPAVLAQLAELLPPGAPLTILLTRTELDCAVNVPAVEARYDVDVLRYTGGITVPRGPGRAAVERIQVAPGEHRAIEAAPGIELQLHSPRLRLLPALWPYDPVSRTLFTSDAFGHVPCAPGADDVLLREGDDDVTSPDEVRATLLAKMGWLAAARTAPVADDLRDVFARLAIDAVAPTHGRVLVGRAHVDRHVAMLERAIRGVGR